MSPKESIGYWLLVNVLLPFLLPLGFGIVITIVISPALEGVDGFPGWQAWASLFTAVEVLLVGLISIVGAGIEYQQMRKVIPDVPSKLKTVAGVCAFFFVVATVTYSGHVFLKVLGASPKTAHVLRPELRTVAPDVELIPDSTSVDSLTATSEQTSGLENPDSEVVEANPQNATVRSIWGYLPITITAFMVFFGGFLHWSVNVTLEQHAES